MASPNKIKNVGYDYKPFQMKASGAKYNNSPIEKNYGSPAQRGFDFTGGVGSKEMEGGVGSAFDYASPAKNIFKKWKKALSGGGGDPASKQKQAAAAAQEKAVAAQTGGGWLEKIKGKMAGLPGGSVEGGGGADHTHPEFAQLDEAAQGGGGMQRQSVNPAKQAMMGGAGGVGGDMVVPGAAEEEVV